MVCELRSLRAEEPTGNGLLYPSSIIRNIKCVNRRFGDGQQHDAHEFLRLLIDACEAHLTGRLQSGCGPYGVMVVL
jgi:ubiquitin C-terminal hydrolase